jgi:hypothetical protein
MIYENLAVSVHSDEGYERSSRQDAKAQSTRETARFCHREERSDPSLEIRRLLRKEPALSEKKGRSQ